MAPIEKEKLNTGADKYRHFGSNIPVTFDLDPQALLTQEKLVEKCIEITGNA